MKQFKSFRQFLESTERRIVVCFGKYQPPTIGHGKMFDAVADIADRRNADFKIFASVKSDNETNPLEYDTKMQYLKEMFPKYKSHFVTDKSVTNMIELLKRLYKDGYTDVYFIAGQDRIAEYTRLLNGYNGKPDKKGVIPYSFNSVSVISAGDRDPESDDVVEAMSGSLMKKHAKNGDYAKFAIGLPAGFTRGEDLFNDVRAGLGLDKLTEIRTSKSDSNMSLREQFIKGKLFKPGDSVLIKETETRGVITKLGPNFVLVESALGIVSRQWINAVVKV